MTSQTKRGLLIVRMAEKKWIAATSLDPARSYYRIMAEGVDRSDLSLIRRMYTEEGKTFECVCISDKVWYVVKKSDSGDYYVPVVKAFSQYAAEELAKGFFKYA